MIKLEDLRPGDVMFGPIGGFVPGILPVGAGQILLANRRARLSWRRWWKIRHVGMVTDSFDSIAGYGPTLVQAMPHGAEEIELTARHWTPEYVYVRPAYEQPLQAENAAIHALSFLGTPYNFLTYAKLAAGILRLPITESLLKRWISTRRDMMCSQLVDQALADAGYHVFDDGRLPQDVVPAELFRSLLALPGQWYRPGDPGGWRDNSDWDGGRER